MSAATTDTANAQAMTTAQSGPYIEFRHVSKAFGDKHVLDNVSFEVNPAETVCIRGRRRV